MKRKVFLLILGFGCLFPQLINAQTNNKKIITVDYCDLYDESKNYERKAMRGRALLSFSTVLDYHPSDKFLYSTECNNKDYFALFDISEVEGLKRWQRFFTGLYKKKKEYLLEIVFTGKLQTEVMPTFGHLGWSRARMTISRIEAIKDVTSDSKIKPPDLEADSPLIATGVHLQVINKELMLYFFGIDGSNAVPVDYYLADDLTVIVGNEEIFDKENHLQAFDKASIKGKKKINLIGISMGAVKREKNVINIFGTLLITREGEKETEMKYENTFRLEEDRWLLTKTRIF